MKRKYDFLPRKLTKEEIILSPAAWIRILSRYSVYRSKALWESKPGFNTLAAILSVAVVKKDRALIDTAINLTCENVPQHIYLSLAGSALSDIGFKEEGLEMVRQAVKLNPSHSMLMNLAANTNDIDEKESLSKIVLNENSKDSDALHHLAYAKYFKGEHGEAECLIDEILSNESDNIFALEFKGNIYFDKKEYDKALEQYLKIKLKPIAVSLQLKICHCFYLLGEIRKAKKIAKKIQKQIPFACDVEMNIERANNLLVEILNA